MAKNKKDKPVYDENGRWVQERSQIKGAIRKVFRQSPLMRDTLEKARVELSPALKKDGTPGKKPRVRYKCAICGNLFPKKKGSTNFIQVDHINPVVPLWKNESEMSIEEIARNIFCDLNNLQVVCCVPMKYNDGKPSCHKKKTDEENYVRRKLAGTKLAKSEDIQIKQEIDRLKEEYKKYLEEKENARRRRKSKKRKGNPSTHKKD